MQILTGFQNATWMVGAYPSLLMVSMYEALAQSQGEPCMSDILNQTTAPKQTLKWDLVSDYLHSLSLQTILTYVPFVSNATARLVCAS